MIGCSEVMSSQTLMSYVVHDLSGEDTKPGAIGYCGTNTVMLRLFRRKNQDRVDHGVISAGSFNPVVNC
jgi:hypothetical protein